jgi:glutathione peroxidase
MGLKPRKFALLKLMYMTMQLMMMLNLLFFFSAPKNEVPKSIYDFKVEAVDGKTIDFAKYKGKKIMIVNTASQCGNTPQYADLQKLHLKYQDKLVIIGFPANNFGAQEPGSNSEIAAFCQKKYSVTFPMAAKISVKGGDMAPIYHWLTEKKHNGYKDSDVRWNFQKYLINEKGELVAVFEPSTNPMSPEIITALNK